MKLPRDMKTKLNKLAHNAGLAYGEQMKAMLSDEVERRIAAGESFAEITAYLDNAATKQRTPSTSTFLRTLRR